jgi:hypothetical protein
VGWWMQWHVNDGKYHLNFSEFALYKPEKKYDKLKETVKLVKEDEMPLNSYLWIHHNAKLTPGQKNLIMDWAGGLRDKIAKENNIVDTTESGHN